MNQHVILLPGLHGTDDLWGPLLASAPPDVHCVMVRYPGDQILTQEQLLEIIEQTVPPDGPLVLVGESFSGPLAIEFAAKHAGRIRGVLLSGSFVTPPWPGWVLRPTALLIRLAMRPLMWLRARLPDRLADRTVGRAANDAIRHVRPRVLASRLQIVAQTDCTTALRQCAAPIAYLQARADLVVHRRSLKLLQSIRPDVRIRSVSGSHLILQHHPREAWEMITDLLAPPRDQ